jgi:hypothetical protein
MPKNNSNKRIGIIAVVAAAFLAAEARQISILPTQ